VRTLRATGKPLVAVVLAGRPLTLAGVVDDLDALLYAWHPGTMGGPAIADVLFGVEPPSGKLPVTFPSVVGQIPIYYAHKNTGKPATPESFVHIDDIEASARQTSFGMTSFHLDAGFEPLFPFGYGLSYTNFSYAGMEIDKAVVGPDEPVTVRAVVSNDGDVEADEVVQLYVRDLVGNVTRPVRELKGFQRVRLKPGERKTVSFVLKPGDLAFYGRDMRLRTEPGEFHVWIGGNSNADLKGEFTIVNHVSSQGEA
jgi:beta-glucosidase